MKNLDSIWLKVFLYGLALVILLAIFSSSYGFEAANDTSFLGILYNFAGIIFSLWMLLSIYLSIRLMLSGPFREQTLTKLTFIRERDEREVMLTGKAAKTTMLTTLAILIFLFCMSCFQVSIYTIPPEMAIDGKTRTLSLDIKFELLEHPQQDTSKEAAAVQKQDILAYTGLPLSGSSVILGLIVWQIIAYNYSMRQLMKY